MATAAIGLGLSVASKVASGIAEHGQLRASARADDENARLAELDGARQVEQTRRDARASDGAALVAQAMNGGGVGGGSALDLLEQSAKEREFAILNTRYQADGQARGLQLQAKQKRSAATGALIGGLLGAGAQALTGISQMRDAGAVRSARGALSGGSTMPVPVGRGQWSLNNGVRGPY